jgi:hypothetical protein
MVGDESHGRDDSGKQEALQRPPDSARTAGSIPGGRPATHARDMGSISPIAAPQSPGLGSAIRVIQGPSSRPFQDRPAMIALGGHEFVGASMLGAQPAADFCSATSGPAPLAQLEAKEVPEQKGCRCIATPARARGRSLRKADQMHAEAAARRQRRQAHDRRVVRLAASFDKGVKTGLDQPLLQPVVRHAPRRLRMLVLARQRLTLPVPLPPHRHSLKPQP